MNKNYKENVKQRDIENILYLKYKNNLLKGQITLHD